MSIVLGSIFIILLALALSLQLKPVQNYVAQKAVDYLSNELNTKISLKSIYFKPFKSIVVEDFQLYSPEGKEILKSGRLEANVNLSQFIELNKIVINKLTIEDTEATFEQFQDSSNISFLIRYFNPPKKEKKKSSKKIIFDIKELIIKNNTFSYVNHRRKHYNKVVDFGDLGISKLNAHFDKIKIDSNQISANIKTFNLREKKGLVIKGLLGQTTVSKTSIELSELMLATNRSTFKNYIKLSYNSFDDFSDFINKVHVKLRARDSRIHSEDIAFFSSPMHQVKFDVNIKRANLEGTVSSINASQVDLTIGKKTSLAGKLQIIGLPDIDKTKFIVPSVVISSEHKDLNAVITDLGNLKNFKLPEIVQIFDKFSFKGSLNGLYNKFKTKGVFTTAIGNVEADALLDIQKEIKYAGNFQSKKFDVGRITKLKDLGTTGFNLQVDGTGTDPKKLSLKIKGDLSNFNFKNYSYQYIQIEGNTAKQLVLASGQIYDPNLKLQFTTDIDWSFKPNYHLDADIQQANLKKLNFFQGDSINIINTKFHTSLIGDNINNITGEFKSDSVNFTSSKGQFVIRDINFLAEGDENARSLTLQSAIGHIDLKGRIDLNTIVPYFKALAMRYAPAIGFENNIFNRQDFDLNINITSFKPIATFFRKDIALDSGATLNAKFESEKQTASFNFYAPEFKYNGIRLTHLIVDQNANLKNMELQTSIDRINFTDSTYIKNVNISNTLANDSLQFNIKMSELEASNSLDLNGVIRFAHAKPAYINFYPSNILINRERWLVNNDAQLKISKGKWYFEKLTLSHDEQNVHIDGILSNEVSDQINLKFQDFNLTSLNGITKPHGINLSGNLNGNIEVNSVFKAPFVVANIKTSPILYNNIPIGSLALSANYDPENQLVKLDSKIEEGNKLIQLQGSYNHLSENNKLNLKAKLVNTDVFVFQPFLRSLVSNIQGKVNADLDIEGDILNPKITGSGKLDNASMVINYLKTPYRLSDEIAVTNNRIFLTGLKVYDPKNNIATIDGVVDLNKLSDPDIDVTAETKNFLVLNTTIKDNNVYYGTAYASGTFQFKGLTSAMNINIRAKSEENTVINIPFNSASTISDTDFIYFIEKDSTKTKKNVKKRDFNGLTMNMDLLINPNAEINLFSSMGELSGRGNSNLNMRISSLGDFEMFGDFIINSGKFNFTAQDYINKIFDLKEGGTVRWAGNPTEANININAIYQQRTSLAPLYNAAGREENPERVLAQADMILKGQLSQPEITFDINFPQNPGVKDELQGYFSDANNVNQQALSLIVRRSFTPGTQTDFGKEVNNTLLSAGTEIAFNQINNIIAQSLNINFFDINIKSLNDASASLRLFNDRLVLTGGISDRRSQALTDLNVFSDRVSTDAEAMFYLRKDGRLVLRASNRLNTRNFLLSPNDGEYISAFGLLYRQEFNTFSEFLKRLFPLGKKTITTAPVETKKSKVN